MLGWTVYEALFIRNFRQGPKAERIRHLINGAVYLLCTVLLLAGGGKPAVLRTVGILFGMLLLIVAVSIVLPGIEPEIESFSDGLWYCFAIVTTIGFGDITATTGIGRILSVILGIYGIIVVSLIIIAIIALIVLIYIEGGYQFLLMMPYLLESIDLSGMESLIFARLGEMGDLTALMGP